MMGKDLSKLESLIKQLEATRKKELEEEEKLASEQATTPVEELIDRVENILDNAVVDNNTIEENTVIVK